MVNNVPNPRNTDAINAMNNSTAIFFFDLIWYTKYAAVAASPRANSDTDSVGYIVGATGLE